MTRVTRARVTVEGREAGAIGRGLLALVGVERGDGTRDVEYVARRIAGVRVFDDGGGGQTDVAGAGGAVLVVSQFTLLGALRRGRRPDFLRAAPRAEAAPVLSALVERLRWEGLTVATGEFGAHMLVESVNDGPYTLWFDSRAGPEDGGQAGGDGREGAS